MSGRARWATSTDLIASKPARPTRSLVRGGGAAVLWTCVLTIALVAGTRSTFAVFIRPIEMDLGLDRATLSLAGALAGLFFGIGQPIAGRLAARLGPRRLMFASVLLVAVGGLGIASATEAWQLFLFAGVIPGLGFAGAGHVPATILLARWFDGRLGTVSGIVSSALPLGQGLFVPLVAVLMPVMGWRSTYVLLGFVLAAFALPAIWAYARFPPGAEAPRHAEARPVSARADRTMWLVAGGYFACGFTDQFIAIHLVALATGAGFDPLSAATVYGILLAVAVVGSWGSGFIADRVRAERLLASLYLLRAACLPLLLLVGPGPMGLLALMVFALLFGLTFISNQAPGSRLVRDRLGLAAIGPMMGNLGFTHHVGGALGIYLGGLSVALAGSYGPAILLSAGLALAAGLSQLAIPRAPVRAAVAPR